jgi:hypothetical protein
MIAAAAAAQPMTRWLITTTGYGAGAIALGALRGQMRLRR